MNTTLLIILIAFLALVAVLLLAQKRGKGAGQDSSLLMIQYQLNDAPGDEPLDNFGVRDEHGKWKPQIDAFRDKSGHHR